MGVGKHYNPELDRQSKIVEMREDWEIKQVEKLSREDGGDEDDEYSHEAHEYFKRTNGASPTEKSASLDEEVIDEKRST